MIKPADAVKDLASKLNRLRVYRAEQIEILTEAKARAGTLRMDRLDGRSIQEKELEKVEDAIREAGAEVEASKRLEESTQEKFRAACESELAMRVEGLRKEDEVFEGLYWGAIDEASEHMAGLAIALGKAGYAFALCPTGHDVVLSVLSALNHGYGVSVAKGKAIRDGLKIPAKKDYNPARQEIGRRLSILQRAGINGIASEFGVPLEESSALQGQVSEQAASEVSPAKAKRFGPIPQGSSEKYPAFLNRT